ncbi:hypothetical protein, partial [Burkholderia glumae]
MPLMRRLLRTRLRWRLARHFHVRLGHVLRLHVRLRLGALEMRLRCRYAWRLGARLLLRALEAGGLGARLRAFEGGRLDMLLRGRHRHRLSPEIGPGRVHVRRLLLGARLGGHLPLLRRVRRRDRREAVSARARHPVDMGLPVLSVLLSDVRVKLNALAAVLDRRVVARETAVGALLRDRRMRLGPRRLAATGRLL